MLIIDLNTLQTVYTLYFLKHVVLCCTKAFDLQDVMWIYTTFCKLISGTEHCSVLDLNTRSIRDKVSF